MTTQATPNVTPAKPEDTKAIFYHKNGIGGMLRLKEGETLEDGIKRLRAAGWIIPDLGQLAIREDEVCQYLIQK